MYSLTISPAVATTVAAHQTRESIETSRLARAASFAREGRGQSEQAHRPVPQHRSRLVWLFGLRSHTAI